MSLRIKLIEERLQHAFSPLELEVRDESEQHIGHAGYQGGGRHFAIVIKASCFDGLTRIAAHQKIYAIFADMIPHEIHALKIKVLKTKDAQ